MAILESVKKLASKVGADTNGRTIAEQINNINRHLDSTGSRDIAEAVNKFADKEDGTAILITKTVTENKTYKATDDGASGYSSVTVNVPSAPVPETFDVTLNIEYIDATSFNFSSSKTLQEALAAHTEGKTLDFTINWTNSGQTFTSVSSNYLRLEQSGFDYFAILFVLNDPSHTVIYPLLWSSDSITGNIIDQPFLYVLPN